MKKSEFKSYDLHFSSNPGIGFSTSDKYNGDAKAYAADIATRQHAAPEDDCRLVENWYHKVGRTWTMTKTVIGEWKYRELNPTGELVF